MERPTSRANNTVNAVVLKLSLFGDCSLKVQFGEYSFIPNKYFSSRPTITEVDCTIWRGLVSTSVQTGPL
jgi:hypothetical protein